MCDGILAGVEGAANVVLVSLQSMRRLPMRIYKLVTIVLLLGSGLLLASCGTPDAARSASAPQQTVPYPEPPSPEAPSQADAAYPAPPTATLTDAQLKDALLATRQATALAGIQVTLIPKNKIPTARPAPTITPGPIPTISSRLATPLPGGNGFLFDKPQTGSSHFMAQNRWGYTTADRAYYVTAGDIGEPDGTHPKPEQGYISIDITQPNNRQGWPPKHIGGGAYETPTRDGPARIVSASVQNGTMHLTIKTNTLIYDLDVLAGKLVTKS